MSILFINLIIGQICVSGRSALDSNPLPSAAR